MVTQRLRWYVLFLFLATAGLVALALQLDDRTPPGPQEWWTLPVLVIGMVTAEHLRIRYRRGDHVDAVTLFEAVLAPLIFMFPVLPAIGAAVASQLITALIRRTSPIKAAFAAGQWSLATAAASLVLIELSTEKGITAQTLVALVAALFCAAAINNVAFTVVLSIANEQRVSTTLSALSPIILPGWVGGWLVNLFMGLLFVLAAAGDPIAVLLFPVPLVVLHLAYRGYASARADRLRLAGLRQAAQVLSEPIDPQDAIDSYLREVAECFEGRAAGLILLTEHGRYEVHLRTLGDEPTIVQRVDPVGSSSLEATLARQLEPVRITTADTSHALAAKLADNGWRDCVCAPLIDERQMGALAVFDQTGLESTTDADLAVLDALARETAHTLERGRLFESVIEQRRRLARIVSTTSDGIFTLGIDGSVLSWNTACERITGMKEQEVLGRRDVMNFLQARTAPGAPVNFAGWSNDRALPREILITAKDGTDRRLSCSASPALDVDGGSQTLVVIARDITPAEQYEELREQFNSLVAAQAAQRLVVDHLQEAVAPKPPAIANAELAVTYVASDPSSPTGGDLYDWHQLPSGDLHVAVVDVLGHGVEATQEALKVVHTLRFAAVEGTPLEQLVARCDSLLDAQESELVATVIVARYQPSTGLLRVVSGGHPPALVVASDGEVTQLAATGGAIGWPAVGSDNVVTTRLNINESLVLYTDGLIEARKDILEGMDSLVRLAADVAHLPAQQFADEIVERALAGADRRDDTLAMVLRRTRVRVPRNRMRWDIDPGDRAGISATRHELRIWLTEHGATNEDPVLVASELLANASVVARSAVALVADVQGTDVRLEVTDDGPGGSHLEELGQTLPDFELERGRGLFLVRTLSHDVSIVSTHEGTSVRCSVPLYDVAALPAPADRHP